MEDYDDSFEEYDNTNEDSYDSCEYSDYDDYGGYPHASKSDSSIGGCLNFALLAIGIVLGIGMFLFTLALIVPTGDAKYIAIGFAITAIGLLSLWLSYKRDKQSFLNLIKVIIVDIFK